MSGPISKHDLRVEARRHLDTIQVADTDAERAAELFRDAVCVSNGLVVAGYWPLGRELDPRPAMDDVIRAGGLLALPVASRENRKMRFGAWDGKSPLVKGEFGIFVPETVEAVDPDVVIVPLLAFDRKGNRLGKGAGHYDATLANLRARRDVLTVGMAHAAQAVLFALPAEAHDQRLDLIITPEGVHDFRV